MDENRKCRGKVKISREGLKTFIRIFWQNRGECFIGSKGMDAPGHTQTTNNLIKECSNYHSAIKTYMYTNKQSHQGMFLCVPHFIRRHESDMTEFHFVLIAK